MCLTFHPRFSKKVHILDWPVVLPPQGPSDSYKQNTKYTKFTLSWNMLSSFLFVVVLSDGEMFEWI